MPPPDLALADQRLTSAADELRTWSGVAIIGAGASFSAGLPLDQNLDPLLWQAVDSDPEIVSQLADSLGCERTAAKSMLGKDGYARQLAFKCVSASDRAREVFQKGFALLDRERGLPHSRAHDALAKLLHRRYIETLVSLNWDTLLEAAYHRNYGGTLTSESSWLWKPHGDAANPEGRWVLPYEPCLVPSDLIAHLTALTADRPRTLLIVGYSERDESIIRRIIEPLGERWKVVRVGPHVTGELDIPLPADEALPELLRRVNSRQEVPGWEYVIFEPKGDLRPALLGRRLGPNDVEVCPRLPEVAELKHLLDLAHSAILVGDSGSGKSITAYQTAYDLSRRGFELLRPIDPALDPTEMLASLTNLPRPTLIVVDDAQVVDPSFLRNLLEKATNYLKVLIVSTLDYSFQRDSVSLDARRAVGILADHLLSNRQATLEAVQQLDDHIGDTYLQIRLEDRIQDASGSETPWQFAFILTGGWLRARALIRTLHKSQRADLLLTAIAAQQLLSEDAGSTLEKLASSAHLLGHDVSWMNRGLRTLRDQRLVLGDERLRCPHARFAEVVVKVISDSAPTEELGIVSKCVREAITASDPPPPLRGVVRLLRTLRFTDRFAWHRDSFVDGRVFRHLADRCWTAITDEERCVAAYLLESLADWHPDGLTEVEDHAGLLGQWLEEVTADSANGFEWLLNDLSHESKAVTQIICRHADPHKIASRMTTINLKDGYAWGRLLRVLTHSASPAWVDQLRLDLPYANFLRLAEGADIHSLFYVGELAQGVMGLRHEVALQMVERVAQKIAERINLAPAEAFAELADIFWYVLGYFPIFLAPRTPSRRQRDVAQAITKELLPKKIARALSRTTQRNIPNYARLLEVLWEVAPSKARAISNAVEIEVLSESLLGLWENPSHDLLHLLGVLARTPDRQPARALIKRHAPEIHLVTPALAIIDPDTAAESLRAGRRLALDVEHGFRWLLAAAGLYEISKRDRDLAIGVVRNNADQIIKGLELRQSNQCDDLDVFVLTVREIAPEELFALLSKLDQRTVEPNWCARLRGSVVERRSVAVLIVAASQATGPIAEVASKLRRKFPSIPRLAQRAEEQITRRMPRKRRRRRARARPRHRETH